MERLERAALLTVLADSMHQKGSWCGETHLQKATYVLEDLLHAGLGLQFVLYKRGPFSFDLRDDLTGMRADLLLEVVRRPAPYGPTLAVTEAGRRLQARHPEAIGKHQKSIDFTAQRLGDKGAAELERLATALWVTVREEHGNGVQSRALRLHELKPYVPMQDATAAVQVVDSLICEVQQTEVAVSADD